MNMIEKVAAAIRNAEGAKFEQHRAEQGKPLTQGWKVYADLSEGGKDYWRCIARAAIEAMREPTEVVLDAGPPYPYMDAIVWRAMIDAALKETD